MLHIVSHRGANRIAPENTYASSIGAIHLGAQRIEIDVRESRDGVLYLMHDATVDRTTNGSGPIAEMTSAEIDKLDAGSSFDARFAGQVVPRLDQFLAWLDGKAELYLEIKQADVQKIADLIRKTNFTSRTFFFSNDLEQQLALRAVAPDFTYMTTSRRCSPEEAKENEGASIFELEYYSFSNGLVERARAAGLTPIVWDYAPRRNFLRQALQAGVEWFNIDDIELLMTTTAELAAEAIGPRGQ